jgi:hypothetical protein
MSISRQQRRYQERKGRVVVLASPPPSPSVERLVSCALIDHEGVTHRGFKAHWELRASLGRADAYAADPSDTYGFWTSFDRFVTRPEAQLIGEVSGQCRPQQRELLSSDIDW